MPKRVELKEVFPAEPSESVDIRDQEPEAEPPVKLGELDGRAKPFRSSGGTAKRLAMECISSAPVYPSSGQKLLLSTRLWIC